MTEVIQQKDGKPSYDARQGRSKLLLDCLNKLLYCQQTDEYNMWLKYLRNIYYICSPYKIDSDQKIKKEIEHTTKLINIYYSQIGMLNSNIVFKKLNDLTEIVLITYKDQFMITTDESNDEFKEDDI